MEDAKKNFEKNFEIGFKEGQERVYIKMIIKHIDPREIGCSEELFQKLYRQVQQMNK